MSNNIDLSQDPYLDDFDPSKHFMQLLAVPGRAEQAREFTQIQSIMLYLLRKLSATVLKEGTIISGMSFTKSGTTVTILSGQIYLEGIVHDFAQANITVTNTGTESIGITVQRSVVTEIDDISLRDQAVGLENFGLPGAHRLKVIPILTLNDASAPVLYKFIDGVLQFEPIKGDTSTDLLARRTYDESGNYRVNGLSLWCESKDSTTTIVNVDSGKAYVLGYEVVKPSSVKITVPRSQATRSVQNEPKTYATGTDTYALTNNPVKQINRVSATVQVTQTITRGGTPNGMDLLPKTPVASLVSVVQGGTTYVSGTDYQLTGDSVNWSLGGAEPSTGTTYSVTWRYNKVMVATTDYVLSNATVSGQVVYYVDFSPSGDNPVNTTQVLVDYDFYLSRKDLISLNRFGEIVITTGQSNIPSLINTPDNSNPDLLHLGTVYFAPNAANGIPNSYAITRMRMEDLQRIATRVEDIEYNQALTDLDDQAMSGESPTSLKGILSDGFIGITKADLSHGSYSAAFSLEEGAIVTPSTNIKVNAAVMNTGTSTAKKWDKIVTAPVVEIVGAEQVYTTGAITVNPYAFPRVSVLKVTPNADNWIDNTSMSIQRTTIPTMLVYRWWYHGGDLWNDTERYLFNNLSLDSNQSWTGWDTVGGTTTASTARTVLDDSTQFIRPITLAIEASNLEATTDNLECYFDGQKVILTATGTTVAGTAAGTIKSNSSGAATATFTIPSGIRTGVRQIELKNGTNSAINIFNGTGRNRIVENRVSVNKTDSSPYSPLAQSFQFNTDKVLHSVGLYFAAKDSTANVVVQIRNMLNGYPGQVILAETSITAATVVTSSGGTIQTRAYFNDPVYCKANTAYCIVVNSTSSSYTLHAAELGQTDIATGTYVSRQPYVDGTLFTSTNSLTWTTLQNKDLKFKIYNCGFTTSSTIIFNAITSLGVDRLLLLAEYVTPQDTGCVWEVKINSGSYEPIQNYKDRSTLASISQVELKATLTATLDKSPIISLDCLNVVGFITGTSGSYISKNVTLSQSYTIVKQTFEGYIPAGCSIVPQFATDTTGTSWTTGTLAATDPIDGFFNRYTYTYTLGSSATNFRSRLNITASAQTDRPKARKFTNIMK